VVSHHGFLLDRYQAVRPPYSFPSIITHSSYRVGVDSNGVLKSSSMAALAQRTSGSSAIEAPIIYAYGDRFYLFTSWDKCCSGTSSTYNIRVGKATSYAKNVFSSETALIQVRS
jgi:hypothetical protein